MNVGRIQSVVAGVLIVGWWVGGLPTVNAMEPNARDLDKADNCDDLAPILSPGQVESLSASMCCEDLPPLQFECQLGPDVRKCGGTAPAFPACSMNHMETTPNYTHVIYAGVCTPFVKCYRGTTLSKVSALVNDEEVTTWFYCDINAVGVDLLIDVDCFVEGVKPPGGIPISQECRSMYYGWRPGINNPPPPPEPEQGVGRWACDFRANG